MHITTGWQKNTYQTVSSVDWFFPSETSEKGSIRKETSVFFAYYKFMIFFLQLLTNISYKPYLILHNQLLCSPIWLPESNKSDRNRTGDSMSRLASLNSIPPTWQSFVFLFKLFSTVYTAKFTFISFLSSRDLWAWSASVPWFFNNVIKVTLFKFLITN